MGVRTVYLVQTFELFDGIHGFLASCALFVHDSELSKNCTTTTINCYNRVLGAQQQQQLLACRGSCCSGERR